MARIRSLHPGFFTDEDLVSVSMAARLLILGLGVEADDKGVFEWKPLTIKMRIFPADHVDVPSLLAEVEAIGAIRSYEADGRKYGAIRNFRRFQRPKTPNDIHPAGDDIRNYVGLEPGVSEAFPPKGEKPPQMEDGGDKGSSEAKASAADVPLDPEKIAFDAGVKVLMASGKSDGQARAVIGKWRKGGQSPAAIIEALGAAQRGGIVEPVSWCEARFKAIRAAEAAQDYSLC